MANVILLKKVFLFHHLGMFAIDIGTLKVIPFPTQTHLKRCIDCLPGSRDCLRELLRNHLLIAMVTVRKTNYS